jgi:hypothetical protein
MKINACFLLVKNTTKYLIAEKLLNTNLSCLALDACRRFSMMATLYCLTAHHTKLVIRFDLNSPKQRWRSCTGWDFAAVSLTLANFQQHQEEVSTREGIKVESPRRGWNSNRSRIIVFWSTDLDPFRYHRLIEYCPLRDCTHFSFIRSLVILYSRVVTPTGYEPLFKEFVHIGWFSEYLLLPFVDDASNLLRRN